MDFEKLPELLMSPYLQIEIQDILLQDGPCRIVKVNVAVEGQIKGARAVLTRESIQDMELSEGVIMNQLLAAVCEQLNKAIVPKKPESGLLLPPKSSIIMPGAP
jgi:hypothetical protein